MDGVQAVIFDLDGTLFDHDGAARAGVSVWLSRLGITPSEETISLWFDAEERFVAAWNRGELDWQGQRRARVRHVSERLGVPTGGDAEVDASFAVYLEAYERTWCAYDDARPALLTVREAGFAVAVLTNGADHQQRAKLAACGLSEHVGAVFSSDAIGVAKPDARSYWHVCEHFHLDPSRVVNVGDRHDIDVIAAREAGLHAVHLSRSDQPVADEPARITTLAELPGMLADRLVTG